MNRTPGPGRSRLSIVECGEVAYEPMAAAQAELAAMRAAGEIEDLALIVEHRPTYTKGRRTDPSELPMGEQWYRLQGIDVVETDRGGRVTYHGPGQLVVYPIVAIDDVRAYVGALERATIASLSEVGIETQLIEGLTGVWTVGSAPGTAGPGPAARKIGSIGIHVHRWVTTHGLAVNVNNDLQPFEWIVPCGIEAVAMTSVCRELGEQADLGELGRSVCARLAEELGAEPARREPGELAPLQGLAGRAEPAVPVRTGTK